MNIQHLDIIYYAEFTDGTSFHATNRENQSYFEEKCFKEVQSGKNLKAKEEIILLYQDPDHTVLVNKITDLIKGKVLYHVEHIEDEVEHKVHNALKLISILKGKIPDEVITSLYTFIVRLELQY